MAGMGGDVKGSIMMTSLLTNLKGFIPLASHEQVLLVFQLLAQVRFIRRRGDWVLEVISSLVNRLELASQHRRADSREQ